MDISPSSRDSFIIPELKRLHSPDALSLSTFRPPSDGLFSILIQAMVGIQGMDSEESFDLVVLSTPDSLASQPRTEILMSDHRLIVSEYSYPAIYEFIKGYVDRCAGKTWQEVATKLGRLGHWEFDGYTETQRTD